MKPSNIVSVLDLALEARRKGEVFNPLFTGEAGLGKSQICQQWVEKQRERNPEFGFLDLRIAYLEAPDLIGFPSEGKDAAGLARTKHLLPEFWPTSGEGLLLFEEPNRGTTGVMNCLMQVLTDRKVHNYKLPPGWIIASCINPESAEYDVNNMDAALKDRFEEFEVEFEHMSFLEYIEKQDWHPSIKSYVGSGMWIYKTPKELGPEATYISPRTWSKMNAAEKAGVKSSRALHRLVSLSVLGKDIGGQYHKYCFDQAPVTAEDLLKDSKTAMKRLEAQCDKNNYQGEMIAQTIESIVKHYGGLAATCKPDQINEDLMAEVAALIPADQALVLLKQCGFKQSGGAVLNFFRDFVGRHPNLVHVLRDNIVINRATKVDK
jgi:hypothetical protein